MSSAIWVGGVVADADLIERARVGDVLQARDGRLAGKAVAALRRAVAGEHQTRVEAQVVEIVGILMARRGRHHARGHHGAVAVGDEELIGTASPTIAATPERLSRKTLTPPLEARLPASCTLCA